MQQELSSNTLKELSVTHAKVTVVTNSPSYDAILPKFSGMNTINIL